MIRCRRLVAFLLLITLTFQIAISSMSCIDVSAATDANGRIQTLMEFSKNKAIDSIGGIGDLTEEDLRAIGVYLSNFYIPFSTEVVTSEDEGEIKEKQAEALGEACGWDEDLATQVVEMIWQMSVASTQRLYLGYKDGDTVKGVSTVNEGYPRNADGELYATYSGFLSFVGWDDNASKFWTIPGAAEDEYLDYESKVLYWKDGEQKKVVFDSKKDEWTASMLSYTFLMDKLPYEIGVGSSLIDVDMENSDAEVEEYVKKWTEQMEETRLQTAVFQANLFIDCFGNILVDCKTHKYVLFPACTNPYVWYDRVEGESSVGKYMNFVNLFTLAEASAGHVSATGTGKNPNYTLSVYEKYDKSLLNLKLWRVQRGKGGDDNLSCDFAGGGSLGIGQTLYDLTSKYFSKKGWTTQKMLFPNFSHFNTAGFLSDVDETVDVDERRDYKSTVATISSDRKKADLDIGVFDDLIVINNMIQYNGSGSTESTSHFQRYDGGIFAYVDGEYKVPDNAISKDAAVFTETASDMEDNMVSPTSNKAYMIGVYCSYLFSFADATDDTVSFRFASNNLPKPSPGSVNWGGLKVSPEKRDSEIKDMIFYFLHPTKGSSYVWKWFKTKATAILTGWHEDMVGRSTASNTTGGTKYIGFTGYVTLPDLNELTWTAWLMSNYNSIVVYLIIIILTILLAYCVVGAMSLQRALLGTFLFMLLSIFPPLCINAVVTSVNSVCNSIYGNKFTYWALVQHQTYYQEVKDAKESGSNDALLMILSAGNNDNSGAGYSSVKVKWMAPKKDNYLAGINKEMKDKLGDGAASSMTLLRSLLTDQFSGESYDDTSNMYLYRDYVDLFTYAKNSYESIKTTKSVGTEVGGNYADALGDRNLGLVTYSIGDLTFHDMWNTIRDDTDDKRGTLFAINSGFLYNSLSNSNQIRNTEFYSTYLLLNSKIANDVNEQLTELDLLKKGSTITVSKTKIEPLFGLDQKRFNTSLNEISQGGDITGIGEFYFGEYTESPFYYIINSLFDQVYGSSLMSYNEDSTGELLKLLVRNNQEYFYNYADGADDGYGELRDYMNMHDMFYYVIPYLNYCNRMVDMWDEKYGMFMYEDVKVKFDDAYEVILPDFDADPDLWTDEMKYKYWHNYNVIQIFNMYSPWVDMMYDCKYAEAETINVLGEKFKVHNPLDPTSYYELEENSTEIKLGRVMVFSDSEMKYYGLEWTDLTTVEQKIITLGRNTYSNLLQVADYYEFNDGVLITSTAMLETFEFNKLFSQTTPFGTNYTMYPQNYELKAFSYDAYLRLILSESTGESLSITGTQTEDGGSFYQTIVENSSLTCGLLLLILDLFAVYAIPALKLFFLIMIFFMSVAMIVSAAIKLEMNIVKTTWDSLISPLLKFTAVCIGMAWLVSLFMSNGNTAVTGRGGVTIQLGDPTMTVLVMLIINIVALILYFKICKLSWKHFISFVKAIGLSIGGAVGGALSTAVGALGGAVGGAVGGAAFAGKMLSDSAARGTAKTRGDLNKPKPRDPSDNTVGEGGEGGSSTPDKGTLEPIQTPTGTAGASQKDEEVTKSFTDRCQPKEAPETNKFDIASKKEEAKSKEGGKTLSDGVQGLFDKASNAGKDISAKSEARGAAYHNVIKQNGHLRESIKLRAEESSNPFVKFGASVQLKKLDIEAGIYKGRAAINRKGGELAKRGGKAFEAAKPQAKQAMAEAKESKVGRMLGIDSASQRKKRDNHLNKSIMLNDKSDYLKAQQALKAPKKSKKSK